MNMAVPERERYGPTPAEVAAVARAAKSTVPDALRYSLDDLMTRAYREGRMAAAERPPEACWPYMPDSLYARLLP